MVEHMGQQRVASYNKEPQSSCCVEEHVHEVFIVVEADAIGDPRAVMIHFQHTSVTLRAVMATVRLYSLNSNYPYLGPKTPLAHAYPTLLFPLKIERHFLSFPLGFLMSIYQYLSLFLSCPWMFLSRLLFPLPRLLLGERTFERFEIFIVKMRGLFGFFSVFFDCIVRQRSNNWMLDSSLGETYSLFLRSVLPPPSDEESPPSSLLEALSAILSVSMSHSLSSGMLPGLVLMVWMIDAAKSSARGKKQKACIFALNYAYSSSKVLPHRFGIPYIFS